MGYLNYELEQEEQLLMLVRKHWLTFIVPSARVLSVLAFCALIFQILKSLPYGMDFLLVVILASILYLVYEIWIWYLDCYIITSKRIIDIDQKGAFKRTVAELDLGSVQEAVYEINGPLEALFGFGSVKIKTSSSGSMIVMEKVPHPENVKRMISDAGQKYNL
jgi:membrane protein YdbS with pleckstrin-like domain